MEKLIEQTQICILICDWTSDDCEESKQFITGKYLIRGLLFSWFRNREIFCDLFLLLYQILLADGIFFLIPEEVSVNIVCLKILYFQITMIVV